MHRSCSDSPDDLVRKRMKHRGREAMQLPKSVVEQANARRCSHAEAEGFPGASRILRHRRCRAFTKSGSWAWGSRQDLFRDGTAAIATGPDAIRAALEKPGMVLKEVVRLNGCVYGTAATTEICRTEFARARFPGAALKQFRNSRTDANWKLRNARLRNCNKNGST